MYKEIAAVLENSVNELTKEGPVSLCSHNNPTKLPSLEKIKDCITLLQSVIFPGYFGQQIDNVSTLHFHIGVKLEKVYTLLQEQIYRTLLLYEKEVTEEHASDITLRFIESVSEIRRVLMTDVEAVYLNDPAAKSKRDVIFCYPAILALTHYRIAHRLLTLGVPLIPRIISELAHSATGIDIHPGAMIGESFSIDHGTGVVIGETCIIGRNVRLYQGVTLGAKCFTLDERGYPVDTPRHPILEDNVTVYSNTSILGRITIGHDSIIGGNVWLTQDVAPYSKIVQHKAVRNQSV